MTGLRRVAERRGVSFVLANTGFLCSGHAPEWGGHSHRWEDMHMTTELLAGSWEQPTPPSLNRLLCPAGSIPPFSLGHIQLCSGLTEESSLALLGGPYGIREIKLRSAMFKASTFLALATRTVPLLTHQFSFS